MPYRFGEHLKDDIAHRLDSFKVKSIDNPELKLAAVALVVTKCPNKNEAAVFLTLRPGKIKRHGGQFALPGGRVDDGETLEQAALRELHEELGLELSPDAILGRLDDYATRSGYRITPIVMWGGEYPDFAPDDDEVEEVYRIPFYELDRPHIPILTPTEHEHPVLSAHIPTVGGSVYAPTAALLYQFREVCIRGEATRVAHFDQPTFAWK